MSETECVFGVVIRILSVTPQHGEHEVSELKLLEVASREGFREHVADQPRHILLTAVAVAYVVVEAEQLNYDLF